jgi:outer membrane translocation and assembly module TamA
VSYFLPVTLFSNLDLEKSKMSEHSVLISRTSQSSDKFQSLYEFKYNITTSVIGLRTLWFLIFLIQFLS